MRGMNSVKRADCAYEGLLPLRGEPAGGGGEESTTKARESGRRRELTEPGIDAENPGCFAKHHQGAPQTHLRLLQICQKRSNP